MKIKTFLSALLLMVSTMASAQKYLNVKLEDGTYRSFKAIPNMEISFDKTAKEGDVVTVNGYKVTVKRADNTPASDVVFSTNIERDTVRIRAVSITNKELICSWDEKLATPAPKDGVYTFTISNISNDVVATVEYKPSYTVKFDMKGHGEAIQDTPVLYGHKAIAPSTPKAASWAFWCWCTDADCTTPYDFSTSVTADLTLYAKWTEGINGHAYVELAGHKWSTENVGKCWEYSISGPGDPGNRWGIYYYSTSHIPYAAQSWGSETDASQVVHEWKLPTGSQWSDLLNNCHWVWTDSYNYITSPYNGMSGYIVYKKNEANSGYTPTTDAHIFLPAAGAFYTSSLNEQSHTGYYNTLDNKSQLFFRKESRGLNNMVEAYSVPVRLVAE